MWSELVEATVGRLLCAMGRHKWSEWRRAASIRGVVGMRDYRKCERLMCRELEEDWA